MKIEMGESLLYSWLCHIKKCQSVQLNWKSSPNWEIQNMESIRAIAKEAEIFFKNEYNYEIYKKSNLDQFIRQSEIDVLGTSFENNTFSVYAVEIAFHTNGLNYGSKEETISRIIKKCIRTSMCLLGYFGIKQGEIIFASPKIHNSIYDDLLKALGKLEVLLNKNNLNYDIKLYANNTFNKEILTPILENIDKISDTSELFLRSIQLYNLFYKCLDSNQITTNTNKNKNSIEKFNNINSTVHSQRLDTSNTYKKIGQVARTDLRELLENGNMSKELITQLQDKNYSKNIFNINFPLLIKTENYHDKKKDRYYAPKIKIDNEYYHLCSEWFEADRPRLMDWICMTSKASDS